MIKKSIILFVLLGALCSSSFSQSMKPDRFLEQRGGDSLWFVERSFAASRFYIGDQRVNFQTWFRHLEEGDQEVKENMILFQQKRRQAMWWELGGNSMALVGIFMALQQPYGDYEVKPAPYVFLGVGLAGMTVGLIQGLKGAQYFRRGLSLYNYKAKNGTLKPVNVLMEGAGTGLSVKVQF
jgi:hypothetical protein